MLDGMTGFPLFFQLFFTHRLGPRRVASTTSVPRADIRRSRGGWGDGARYDGFMGYICVGEILRRTSTATARDGDVVRGGAVVGVVVLRWRRIYYTTTAIFSNTSRILESCDDDS